MARADSIYYHAYLSNRSSWRQCKTVCYTGAAGSSAKLHYRQNPCHPNLSIPTKFTFAASFPPGGVAKLEPKPYVSLGYSAWPSSYSSYCNSCYLCRNLWYIIYPIWLPVKWFLHGRDPMWKLATAWFDLPQTKLNAPLPCRNRNAC